MHKQWVACEFCDIRSLKQHRPSSLESFNSIVNHTMKFATSCYIVERDRHLHNTNKRPTACMWTKSPSTDMRLIFNLIFACMHKSNHAHCTYAHALLYSKCIYLSSSVNVDIPYDVNSYYKIIYFHWYEIMICEWCESNTSNRR